MQDDTKNFQKIVDRAGHINVNPNGMSACVQILPELLFFKAHGKYFRVFIKAYDDTEVGVTIDCCDTMDFDTPIIIAKAHLTIPQDDSDKVYKIASYLTLKYLSLEENIFLPKNEFFVQESVT